MSKNYLAGPLRYKYFNMVWHDEQTDYLLMNLFELCFHVLFLGDLDMSLEDKQKADGVGVKVKMFCVNSR